jgi:hypothetical protein
VVSAVERIREKEGLQWQQLQGQQLQVQQRELEVEFE